MDKRFRCKARSVKYTRRLNRARNRAGDRAALIQQADLKRWFFRIKSRGDQSMLRRMRACDRPPPTLALLPPLPRSRTIHPSIERVSPFHKFQLINRYRLRRTCKLQTCRSSGWNLPESRSNLGNTPNKKIPISLPREGIANATIRYRWYVTGRDISFFWRREERKEESLISRFSNSIHVFKFHRGCSSRSVGRGF